MEDDILVSKSTDAKREHSNRELQATTPQDDEDYRLPSLNTALKLHIRELHEQAQSSSSLLQKFLPEDEPDLMWDHSPEFLTNDGHNTWGEGHDIDQELEQAIAPRNLFQARDSPPESLTSTDSEDSLFFNNSNVFNNTSSAILRSDIKRKVMHKRTRRPVSASNDLRCEPFNQDTQLVFNKRNFTVCNLSREEMEIEDTVYQAEGSFSTAEQREVGIHTPCFTAAPRVKRSTRKEIDYRHFNSYGFQEIDGGEKKKKPR